MNAKEATAKKEEKLADLLREAEGHPMMKAILAEKAAAILAKRTEAAGKIGALKMERDEVIPKLIEDRDVKEAKYKETKAALDTAGSELQMARSALSSRSQSFDHAIGQQEQILIESADPMIDEAITFFREKLDYLRSPGRISFNRLGGESNIFTEKVTLKVESNVDAINSALQYCMAAIKALEMLKLSPSLDIQIIEEMKKGIPDIGIFMESTNERPMDRIPPMIVPRFGGAASDGYEQTLLDRFHKKINEMLWKEPAPANPAIPTPAKKRAEAGKH